MIIPFEKHHTKKVIQLWNTAAVTDGYKPMTPEAFDSIFTKSPYFSTETAFVLDTDEICGFACGLTGEDLPLGAESGYITCVVLSPSCQTAENYNGFLNLIEEAFRRRGKRRSEILFFNPMMLPWYIPGTPLHEHNNAPGVPVDSHFYTALLANGYVERTREQAMYLNLEHFAMPSEAVAREASAAASGYEVALFDPSRYNGVSEMLEGLGNPLWQKEITECTEKGIPVVVGAYEGKTVGFAGPVIRQESGRGYFTGIGVHPHHEGHGLGSLLFFKLCQAFKDVGAGYMSLYTGTTNPAAKIYLKAGFRAVREFAVMRKEL